ncbi:low choriolytic enzyme isoform X2 [Nematostella vectensis]|nr:low choriolytic enzyme isoform X2 [Nematostella vectensis]XP_032222684.1 low choriolytic enzyme isoform X2 [Nematostella vectensis]XP_048585303.1 low choriolytic enzyme isoform X2 [Nematostella vectensis]
MCVSVWKVLVLGALLPGVLNSPASRYQDVAPPWKRLEEELKDDFVMNDALKRGAIDDSNYRWPSSVKGGKTVVKIPYVIGGMSTAHKDAISRAVAEYNAKTCIRFVPRAKESDYLKIQTGIGCNAEIGRKGGVQYMILGKNCQFKGKVLHEMMHTLGFLHEQCRQDRDKYVAVHLGQVRTGFIHNFDKYSTQNVVSEYDLHSVMHYSNNAFAKGSSPTITAKNNPGMKLGSKNDFSKLDLKRINTLYGCSEANDDYENYDVTVVTNGGFFPEGEGTDAYVYFELVGKDGRKSGESDIASGGYENDFERGKTENFLVAFKYVGEIAHLKVRLEQRSSLDAWKIDKIVIKDPRSKIIKTFTYSKWIKPGKTYTL